ncbi:hypothetical protein QYE76_023313 [Lolium multiflorum]|uniref:Endonuclease/exonuclease/phosphatase domain-containing protein n=1 Tax=Lolium multiflorum TaxID=4521 RepID=A0AAD8VU18_LOLMU|nr:hypothetical protein QYE76_023313 [Lolium multiflorum]
MEMVDQNSPVNSTVCTPQLHLAPAISRHPTVRQLLLEDSPIPALGATVARAPRSKAVPAQADRKSARGKGLTDGPVLERAIRYTADKNASSRPSTDKTAATSPPAPQILGAPMRVLFWNIRGFGRKGRRTLLKDYLRLHRIDVVLLQETIKQDFSDAELRSLEIGDKFFWDWLPASGHSGGMLIGVRDSMFEVGAISRGQFFLSVAVLHRVSNRTMDIIGVYGPADHGRSREFLQELSAKIATSTRPLLLGGDFNLIRAAEDKNNSNLNWTLIDLFNDNIASWGLREIPRTGARFTWTNRQLNPVRSALDRVFVSPNFEAIFPLCSLAAETSLGSDHTPLVFDTGEGFPVRNNRFFFESAWLERPEFRSIVHTEWANLSNKVGGRDILDWWNFMSAGLRQHLRGWSHNLGRDSKESKAALLAQITQLDAQADAAGLDEEGWAARYHLEEQLLHLYRVEEEYWKQRGRTNWTLHGDANTAYFHAVANGRRRKCHISMLNTEQGPITDQRLIQQHIYAFYRELLGTTAARSCGLAPDTWAGGQRVSQAEKDRLALTFSEEELENIVKDMKTNTAPGPDGLPVIFFKTFWPLVTLQGKGLPPAHLKGPLPAHHEPAGANGPAGAPTSAPAEVHLLPAHQRCLAGKGLVPPAHVPLRRQ